MNIYQLKVLKKRKTIISLIFSSKRKAILAANYYARGGLQNGLFEKNSKVIVSKLAVEKTVFSKKIIYTKK